MRSSFVSVVVSVALYWYVLAVAVVGPPPVTLLYAPGSRLFVIAWSFVLAIVIPRSFGHALATCGFVCPQLCVIALCIVALRPLLQRVLCPLLPWSVASVTPV